MPEQTTAPYFYVLVLKIQTGGHSMNHAIVESRGPIDVPVGGRVTQVFEEIRTRMLEQAHEQGMGGNATTEFWSLTPDAL